MRELLNLVLLFRLNLVLPAVTGFIEIFVKIGFFTLLP